MDLNSMNPDNMEQRTPEWHYARKGRITASSVGAILGNNPHTSRDDVLRRMVREWRGAPREFSGNVATEYGERNEAGAFVEYQMETGSAVQAVGFITREEWAGCSPDGLIGRDGGLEIKCPYGKRNGGDFKPLSEQPHYYDQVQFSLWVTGRKTWHFYQWAPTKTALEIVTPDRDWALHNLPKLRAFWEEYLIECQDGRAQRHLDAPRLVIDTPEALQRLAEYDDLIEAIEQAEARKKELLAQFVEMAKGQDATLGGRNLTRVERPGSISYGKVVKDLLPGADLEPYRGKPSEHWVLK